MQRFFILLALILSISACTDSKSDTDSELEINACNVIGLNSKTLSFKDSFGKIINGTACEDAPAPVVVLAIDYASGSALCTGTMLTTTSVLTAAHCFLEQPVSVLVGNPIFSVPSVSARGASLHPGFSIDPLTAAFYHDVAIVQLESELNVPTLPIFASRPVQVDDTVSIFGYGQDEKKDSGVLKSGEMRVSSISPDFIIANFNGEGSNTCFGDSGGPMIQRAKTDDGRTVAGIIGITSGGTTENCKSGDVSSFANVQSQSNLDFIRSQVGGVRIE